MRDKNSPLTEHGHLDATNDAEQLATWFGLDYPKALVGYATGKSGVVVLDIDKKDARDGFETIDQQWLDVPKTYSYDTLNNGIHHIYLAPEGVRLNGQADYRGMTGVDRRGGSSYAVYWGTSVPESRSELATAPEWLLDPAGERVGSSFEGGLDTWLAGLEPGEPTERVLAVIERIPSEDFGHDVLISLEYNLVRLAAEGHTGVRDALEILRSEWLRGPYDTADWAYQYDLGLSGAISKAGAEDADIASLPKYMDALNLLPSDFERELWMGNAGKRADYFTLIRHLVRTDLDDAHIASIVWSAPRTKPHAREFGIGYLHEQITKAREAPEPDSNPVKTATYYGTELLTPEERDADRCSFLENYLEWVSTRVNVLNAPYHRANALTLLALTIGECGFLDVEVETMNLNLFIMGMGESSTGKSQSLSPRRNILNFYYAEDPSYNLGADASIPALHRTLLDRDGRVSFFNSDEAAGVFMQLKEQKWSVGMVQKLTDWYGGRVEPMLRSGDKKEERGKTAHTVFSMTLFGVEDDLAQELTESMFKSGFLARFIWYRGEGSVDDPSRFVERRGSNMLSSKDEDKAAKAFAIDLALAARKFNGRRAIGATQDALDRMGLNRRRMDAIVEAHPNRAVMEPSIRRLGDNIAKVAALLAMVEGRMLVTLPDAVAAIGLAEEWVANLITISGKITASTFQRDCDMMEAYIGSQGGSVPESKLYHRFKNVGTGDYRDFTARVISLEAQARIKKIERGGKTVQWEINKKGEV